MAGEAEAILKPKGGERMNYETLLEAYNQLQRDYVKAQNKLQDIYFLIKEE